MSVWDFLSDSGNAAGLQALATIVLVLVTIIYVIVTGRMARAAGAQAHEAKRAADAAVDGLRKAYADGLRLQEQLVQRQAVLEARADLCTSLDRSIESLAAYGAVVRLLSKTIERWDSDSGDEAVAPDLRIFERELARPDWRDYYVNLDYLADFIGPFPLSESSVDGAVAEARVLDTAFGELETAVYMAVAVGMRELSHLNERAKTTWQKAVQLEQMLEALRHAVRVTGYERAVGHSDLNSTVLPEDAKPLSLDDDGKWRLGA